MSIFILWAQFSIRYEKENIVDKKILFLETDNVQSQLFTTWLRGQGHNVSPLDNYKEMSAVLLNEKFDLLIIDIDDPSISDELLSLCEAMKKDAQFLKFPIIVLTYKKDIQKIAKAIDSGIDGFLLKPFDIEQFLKL